MNMTSHCILQNLMLLLKLIIFTIIIKGHLNVNHFTTVAPHQRNLAKVQISPHSRKINNKTIKIYPGKPIISPNILSLQ